MKKEVNPKTVIAFLLYFAAGATLFFESTEKYGRYFFGTFTIAFVVLLIYKVIKRQRRVS